jgi:MFS family permease
MFHRKLKIGHFALTGLNIYATAYYGNYIFFLLRKEYGFGNEDNLLYAALGGFLYVFGSLYGGNFAQRRGYYFALKIGFSIMAVSLATGLFMNTAVGQLIVFLGWNLGMCFTWPTLEALASEGEDRKGLTKMLGIYNVVWAGGAAVTYFTGGALFEGLGPQSLFWFPAALHVTQFAMLLVLERRAQTLPAPDASITSDGAPIDLHDAAVPLARRKTFLRLAWIANPFAYIAMNTVLPLIPDVAARLGLSTTLAGFVCSVWMFARLFSFAVLWRWSGWHYRFGWLAGAYVAMIGSFGALLLVENLAVVVMSQLVFGVAVGVIYYSSLFYSMDVGETKGEHGGFHEALIGVGLCGGPAIGTVALRVFPSNPDAGTVGVAIVLVVGLCVVLVVGVALGGGKGELAQKSLR